MSIEEKYPGLLSNVTSFIKQYANLNKFRIPEKYAEVNITDTIDTQSDVETHINWLISENQVLRQASSMGSWTSPSIKSLPPGEKLNLESDLGFDYSEQLRNLEEIAEEQFVQSEPSPASIPIQAPVEAVEIAEVKPSTGEIKRVPIVKVKQNVDLSKNTDQTKSEIDRYRYFPIGRVGVVGQKERKYGKTYVWNGTRWEVEKENSSLTSSFGGFGTTRNNGRTIGENLSQIRSTPRNNSIRGGGSKIICNELYNQGFLSQEIWEADERFGEALYQYDREALLGYMMWGKHIVRLMRNYKNFTPLIYFLFRPWTLHMAYIMGVVSSDNFIGNITHKIGLRFSRWYYGYRLKNIIWG